jgi:hypothetical protein
LAGDRNERRDRLGVIQESLTRGSDWSMCKCVDEMNAHRMVRMPIARPLNAHRGTCLRVLRSAEHLIVVLGMCPDDQGILLNSRFGGRR